MVPTRDEAWALLTEYNQSDALLKHALAVEGVMRHFAKAMGGDPDTWGVVGLLHDLDYERFPETHCAKTGEIMRTRGIDEEIVRACESHGYGVCNGVEPLSQMERVLFTIDELTGLIGAVAIMRPSKSVMDLELKSVKKKYKTRSFAAGCDRDLIERGANTLSMDVDQVILEVIFGMREVAGEIGLE